jgi:parvulin-like peptidyl-prolyl isomerase
VQLAEAGAEKRLAGEINPRRQQEELQETAVRPREKDEPPPEEADRRRLRETKVPRDQERQSTNGPKPSVIPNLNFKGHGIEGKVVRQSFNHGYTKPIVVEAGLREKEIEPGKRSPLPRIEAETDRAIDEEERRGHAKAEAKQPSDQKGADPKQRTNELPGRRQAEAEARYQPLWHRSLTIRIVVGSVGTFLIFGTIGIALYSNSRFDTSTTDNKQTLPTHQTTDAAKPMLAQEVVRARHILVETEDEAKAILDQLKGGADFATLARQKSKDPGAAEGGDLGYFTKEQMVPEFADAAFKMYAGQISNPVKTQFGWHIIKVEDKGTR